MSIVVPPASSHEAASEALKRLERYAQDDAVDESSGTHPIHPRGLLVAACLLSAIGSFLLVCAIAISCAPQSAISQAALSVCSLLL